MAANPEAVLFKFVPITSLLNGIPGSGYLSHAINLYLRCKFIYFVIQFLLFFLVHLYETSISACFFSNYLELFL